MANQPGTSISLTLRLAKALAFARRGKLKEAQAAIAGDRTIPDEPLALEALAALATGEGDYLRALKLWELLRQRVPNHPEANRMIPSIELWLARPGWMRFVPWVLTTVGILLVTLLIVWALKPAEPPPKRTPRPTPSVSAPSPVTPLPPAGSATPSQRKSR